LPAPRPVDSGVFVALGAPSGCDEPDGAATVVVGADVVAVTLGVPVCAGDVDLGGAAELADVFGALVLGAADVRAGDVDVPGAGWLGVTVNRVFAC
jgi:hypothetical protein